MRESAAIDEDVMSLLHVKIALDTVKHEWGETCFSMFLVANRRE